MEESIKNYKVGKVDSINANIMTPYANFVDYKEFTKWIQRVFL